MTDSPRDPLPPPPDTPAAVDATMQSYKRALEQIARQPDAIERLSRLAIAVSAELQKQSSSSITQTLLTYASQKDSPVSRSTRTAARSPSPDRAAPQESRPRPAAWELLGSRQRMGPRLAQKLILAEARRGNR